MSKKKALFEASHRTWVKKVKSGKSEQSLEYNVLIDITFLHAHYHRHKNEDISTM